MSLIAELKRRSVFKVGAAYLVVGWLAVQAASIGFPAFDAPVWALRVFIFVLLIGFPLALVMAWMFVVTPEGVRVEMASIGNARIFALAAVLVALAIGWYLRGQPAVLGASTEPRSIAVLPFVNMSGDPENEYFSDGISEEILNVLAQTPELRVAARTSSFAFKGENKEIPEIARELEVRMVLEGSVRKQADHVRITAQLVDAENGFHVWSQTYDRELKDIFEIQDEIARAIALELQVKLGGAARAESTSVAAYDLYLKGIARWQARGQSNLREADRLFRAAIALDPGFAKAWAGIALTHVILPEWSSDPIAESFPIARDAAEHASAIDPNLPEPYAVLGTIAYAELRFATGRRMFERALALAPSYATGAQWFGEMLDSEGDQAKAVELARRAVRLDPISLVVRDAYARALFHSGRDAEALVVCNAVLSEDPRWNACLGMKFDLALQRKDYAAARATLRQIAAAGGPAALVLADQMIDLLEGRGDAPTITGRFTRMQAGAGGSDDYLPVSPKSAILWFTAIGRNDLALESYAGYARKLPHMARILVFDPHFGGLRCEEGYRDILVALKVDEAQMTSTCEPGA